MPTQKKQQMVEALGEKLKDTNGVILTEYLGMTVAEISELRAKLRALSCEYTVVKNTLEYTLYKKPGDPCGLLNIGNMLVRICW